MIRKVFIVVICCLIIFLFVIIRSNIKSKNEISNSDLTQKVEIVGTDITVKYNEDTLMYEFYKNDEVIYQTGLYSDYLFYYENPEKILGESKDKVELLNLTLESDEVRK